MKIDVIIPSAGSGSRMNTNTNKLFLPLSGGCVLEKTLKIFLSHPDVNKIVLPYRECDKSDVEDLISKLEAQNKIVLSTGGKTRTESVVLALNKIETPFVLIHDGARPFVDNATISRVIEKTVKFGACIPVISPQDTVKECDGEKIIRTLRREDLVLVQTPQGFDTEKLKNAYAQIKNDEIHTDDSSVYEKIGTVYVTEGNKDNLKITTQDDLKKEYFCGVGFDAHRFDQSRPLFLGGVKIPYEKGLLGHSDADVVLHALMDALLSAIHERDIGYHFPCTDEFKDISSVDLLKKVLAMVKNKGAEIVNASIVIVAEKPKLSPFIQEISENIASLLKIEQFRVSLTATTTEKLGFTGREEGIATEAIVSIRI